MSTVSSTFWHYDLNLWTMRPIHDDLIQVALAKSSDYTIWKLQQEQFKKSPVKVTVKQKLALFHVTHFMA